MAVSSFPLRLVLREYGILDVTMSHSVPLQTGIGFWFGDLGTPSMLSADDAVLLGQGWKWAPPNLWRVPLSRIAAPPHQEEPTEAVQASGWDDSLMPLWGAVFGVSEQALGLEGLGGAGSVGRIEGVDFSGWAAAPAMQTQSCRGWWTEVWSERLPIMTSKQVPLILGKYAES